LVRVNSGRIRPNQDGYYSTSICSSTKRVEKAKEEAGFLKKFAPNRGVGNGSQSREQ
jgi:hypothetical protein